MKRVLMAMVLLFSVQADAETYQKLVAKVGDDIITSWDVEEAVQIISASMSPAERASEAGQQRLKEARETVMKRMIDEKLVVLAARKGPEGYAEAVDSGQAVKNPFLPGESEVESQMEKLFDETRKRFGSQKAFEEGLERERIKVRELRQRLRQATRVRLTFEKMMGIQRQMIRRLIRVGDDEAKEHYEKNRSTFAIGEQVRIRHILVSKDDEKLARDLVARLDKGEAFGDLAKRYSKDDFTKTKGGQLGWVEKGQMRWPAMEKAAFGAKVGQVVGPVKTSEGWHVVRVDDINARTEQDFETVKPRIKNILYAQKIQGRIDDWIKGLREEHYVELFD